MSVLTQKLQEASKLFQSHNFKKSLEAYQDCVKFCQKTQEDQSIIHNILSTQATLEYILGDFDKALSTLNSVLYKNNSHFLCLLRRSQVYKKQGKLVRALKDLQKIFVYCPDNLQISAFKVEIEHMLLKQGSNLEQLSDSQQEDQGEDQLLNLNFMNLKLIDRKSSDISSSKMKQRKSRVTILGDTLIQYNREDTNDTNEEDNELVSDKDIRTQKQIQIDDQNSEQTVVPIKVNVLPPKKPKHSILKNKGTSIFIAPENSGSKKELYLGRQSKLLSMLKSIDGKVISSSDNQLPDSSHQVKFRKSVSQVNPLEIVIDESNNLQQLKQPKSPSPSKKSAFSSLRKSCLKRPSFDVPEPKLQNRRSSKFDLMDIRKIDGKVLHHSQKIDKEGDNVINSDSDNQASSHNIFGDDNYVMPEHLKQKLGISQDNSSPNKLGTQSMKMSKKQSILKKSSLMMSHQSVRKSSIRQSEGAQFQSMNLKAKKSVMFNCTL